jgi:hypothetical protein
MATGRSRAPNDAAGPNSTARTVRSPPSETMTGRSWTRPDSHLTDISPVSMTSCVREPARTTRSQVVTALYRAEDRVMVENQLPLHDDGDNREPPLPFGSTSAFRVSTPSWIVKRSPDWER